MTTKAVSCSEFGLSVEAINNYDMGLITNVIMPANVKGNTEQMLPSQNGE